MKAIVRKYGQAVIFSVLMVQLLSFFKALWERRDLKKEFDGEQFSSSIDFY